MRIERRLFLTALLLCLPLVGSAQLITTPDSIARRMIPQLQVYDSIPVLPDTAFNQVPRIRYTQSAQPYIVGRISVHGTVAVDSIMIKNNLGIFPGDTIMIPGDAINIATRSLLDRRFFSNMKVGTTFREDTVDLDLFIRERIQVRGWEFHGIKQGEVKDLREKLRLRQNNSLTDYQLASNMTLIRQYYDDKAFRNAEIDYVIVPDTLIPSAVVVHYNIERNKKVRIGEIEFEGNDNLSSRKMAKSMKKTNKVSINFLKSFKFKEKDFEEDLENVRNYGRSQGYRDMEILDDSTYLIPGKSKRMGVWIKVKEGNKYHYRNISWLGNTIYTTEYLQHRLGIEKGDVYDSETMAERLGTGPAKQGEYSIRNTYTDQGYFAFMIDPVESVIPGDSVDVEIRIIEGSQFRIKNVTFDGNTRTNDHVIRRELATMPGELYSESLLLGTYQRLATMGQFDANSFSAPQLNPNMQEETVNIHYSLVEVPNDQLEISAGWGAGMFIASVGVNFTNISIRNFFNKGAWRPYPAGDNQTIGFKVQTNGTYYRAFSTTFTEPWLGGRKPNSLSLTFFTSRETDDYYYTGRSTAHFGTLGGTVNFGKRLSWPDPNFIFTIGLTYTRYNLKAWDYFLIKNGNSNILALNLGLSRNTVDDPIQYATRGSNFSVSAEITPPWSSFDGKDYSQPMTDADRYKWIEYHKWKVNAQWFFALSQDSKLVLMARAQYGYLGHYNKHKISPFEGFSVGGDGLSGYSVYGTEPIGVRGYKENALTPLADYGYYGTIYSKYTAEVRYPLVRSAQTMVYMLIFGEAANAYNELKDFKPFSLKRSAGVGLRVYLPYLGLMGIDWGYGFDKTSSSNGKAAGGRFGFTLGQTF